jgi:hypothetical protein
MLPTLDDVAHAITSEEEAALLSACLKSGSRFLLSGACCCAVTLWKKNGSSGRTRTYNPPVNSPPLFRCLHAFSVV